MNRILTGAPFRIFNILLADPLWIAISSMSWLLKSTVGSPGSTSEYVSLFEAMIEVPA